MIKIIEEIEQAATEAERRQVLQRHRRQCRDLLVAPSYPESTIHPGKMNTRDHLHLVATVSLLGLQHRLLLRYVYVAECEPKPEEGLEFDVIRSVSCLEMASQGWSGEPPRWEVVGADILSHEIDRAIDNLVLEHEKRKTKQN